MAKILDGICSNTPILEGIDDWPRSASKKEWFRITRELIQSVIADMDLDPDSLSQVEEASLSLRDCCERRLGGCTFYAAMAINHRHHSISPIFL